MFDLNQMENLNIFRYIFFYLFGFIISFVIDKFYLQYNTKSSNNFYKKTKQNILLNNEKQKLLIKYKTEIAKLPIIKKYYVVVGIGGVGSKVLMNLIRVGVKKIKVIDFDTITLSSLNRHAFAKKSDVGKYKSDVVKEYCVKCRPDIEIESISEPLLLENLEKFISKDNPDVIVDCIDDLNAKAELFKFCYVKKLKLFSSMGAAGKCDPTTVRYKNFNEIQDEVLARKLRLELRKKMKKMDENDVNKYLLPDFKCVYSCEKVERELAELTEEQKQKLKEYKGKYNERVRSLPVFACMPSAFGTCLSAISINL